MMNAVKQPCCFYGYDEYGFVLAWADGSDYQNILDDDSLYIRICRLYYEAESDGTALTRIHPDSSMRIALVNTGKEEFSSPFLVMVGAACL